MVAVDDADNHQRCAISIGELMFRCANDPVQAIFVDGFESGDVSAWN